MRFGGRFSEPLVLVFLGGCCPSIPTGVFACFDGGACPDGQVCIDGLCEGPTSGASTGSLASASSGSVSASGQTVGASMTSSASGGQFSSSGTSSASVGTSATVGISSGATSSPGSSTGRSSSTGSATASSTSSSTSSSGASSSSGGSTTGSSCQGNPDGGNAVTPSAETNIAYDPTWVTGIYRLGAKGGIPENNPKPGPLTVDDTDPCNPIVYVLDVQNGVVLKYDVSTDSFSSFFTVPNGATQFNIPVLEDILFVSDFNSAGPTLLISQDGFGFANKSPSTILAVAISGPSASSFSGTVAPANFTPTGLVYCEGESSDTILSIDNNDIGQGAPNKAEARFWSAAETAPTTVSILGSSGQLATPYGQELLGATGTGFEGHCELSAPIVFATQYTSNDIWWFKLDGTTPGVDLNIPTSSTGCSLKGNSAAGHSCTHNPYGVRYSAGGHLVWANSINDVANPGVGYAQVNATNGAVSGTPAFLLEGGVCSTGCNGPNLTQPTGLAFDRFGNLYVGDEGGNVFRVTVAAGF